MEARACWRTGTGTGTASVAPSHLHFPSQSSPSLFHHNNGAPASTAPSTAPSHYPSLQHLSTIASSTGSYLRRPTRRPTLAIMSGLPYLQKLRKSDLTEFAETSKLSEYVQPSEPSQTRRF